jgi:hypothetical protein
MRSAFDAHGHAARLLPAMLALYTLASLIHFIHNAEYLAYYPNMPAWITGPQVYATWAAIAMVGLTGWLVFRTRFKLPGLAMLAAYAALGFDGLAHYSLALCSQHSLAMNVTIWGEVISAALLLTVVGVRAVGLRRLPTPTT